VINAGAIVVSSLFPGGDPDERFGGFLEYAHKACGNPDLEEVEGVHCSERNTSHNNRSLGWIMNNLGVFSHMRSTAAVDYIEGVLDVCFRLCTIGVTAVDLARFAAIVANMGSTPGTRVRLASSEHVVIILALMANCGLYDGAGTYAAKIDIPANSGVGVIATVPGNLGIITYGFSLDSAGNSCFALYSLERIVAEEQPGIFSRPRRLFSFSTFDTRGALDELVELVGRETTSGHVAAYIPELAKVPPKTRGVSVVTLDGNSRAAAITQVSSSTCS
jgi:glutaminase